jgi:predicted TIM-barrel fold metal-dependent hydrolase
MNKIDVQHHILPPEYVKKLKDIGITESYGQPIPNWTPEKSLAFMKKIGIATAIGSVSTPGVYFKNDEFSRDLAHLCNEYSAELKKKYPGKFGGFASLPLPFVQGALEELKYALDELKLDGVVLLSNYNGKYLGDESFEDVFNELNKRKAVVFIHPTDPKGDYDAKLGMPNSLIEAPFETTRAVANLIYTGTMDRYPDIRYILAHGGGTIPYLGWKIALMQYSQKDKKPPIMRTLWDFLIKGGPVTGLQKLKNMYYDTTLASSKTTILALQEFVGSKHIVYGTDFPFGAKFASLALKDLKNFGFSEEDRKAIDYKNCLNLFPQLQVK